MKSFATTVRDALSKCPYRDRIDFVADMCIEVDFGTVEQREVVEVTKGAVVHHGNAEPNLWLTYGKFADGLRHACGGRRLGHLQLLAS